MGLPGQKWYYNSNSGAVEQHYPATFFEVHLGIGWHGPFDTKQQALDFYSQNAATNPGWVAPTGLKQQIDNIPSTLGNEATNATVGSSGVFSGWAWFGDRHNWVRVIWGVSGVGLVFIGLAVMFRQDIAAAAKTAAKTAVL